MFCLLLEGREIFGKFFFLVEVWDGGLGLVGFFFFFYRRSGFCIGFVDCLGLVGRMDGFCMESGNGNFCVGGLVGWVESA